MKASLLLPLLPAVAALPAQPGGSHVQPVARALHSERYLAKRDLDINAILAKIVGLFPVNVAVTKISNLITLGEIALATLFNIDTTEDDLSSSKCADITIIFSRGTTETGNVGALVGPPFFDALETKLGGAATVAVQGVKYAADVPGFLAGGDPQGSQTMANLVSSAISKCPKTKLVMSGYSQGGQLVHNAAKLLSSKITAAVSSVVIFGDPDYGQAVKGVSADKTLVICHDGDNICDGGSVILLPHLTYAENAEQAANFVAAKAGF